MHSRPIDAGAGVRIRTVPIDRPWFWLADAWRDLIRFPQISAVYGLALAVASALLVAITFAAGLLYLVLPLTAGFFLVAPILAVGLYEISRRQENALPVSMRVALMAWRRNGTQIALMGFVLMLFHLVWLRIASLLAAAFLSGANPRIDTVVDVLWLLIGSLPFILAGTIIGAALAVAVFMIGAVSIPMLLDRDVTVPAAIATSCAAVWLNRRPMALWAALIIFFTSIGFVTLFVGLVVVLPLIGYASWYAYRDLVD